MEVYWVWYLGIWYFYFGWYSFTKGVWLEGGIGKSRHPRVFDRLKLYVCFVVEEFLLVTHVKL